MPRTTIPKSKAPVKAQTVAKKTAPKKTVPKGTVKPTLKKNQTATKKQVVTPPRKVKEVTKKTPGKYSKDELEDLFQQLKPLIDDYIDQKMGEKAVVKTTAKKATAKKLPTKKATVGKGGSPSWEDDMFKDSRGYIFTADGETVFGRIAGAEGFPRKLTDAEIERLEKEGLKTLSLENRREVRKKMKEELSSSEIDIDSEEVDDSDLD